MEDHTTGRSNSVATFLFIDGYSEKSGVIRAIIERGPLLGLVMLMSLLIGTYGFYLWSQQQTAWDGTPGLVAIIFVGFTWHYLSFVTEVQVTTEHLSVRRLKRFRSIPWQEIVRVRIYSLRTVGITYVWVTGRHHLPLAFFSLWVQVHRPETWKLLIRLVDNIASRVAVTHAN